MPHYHVVIYSTHVMWRSGFHFWFVHRCFNNRLSVVCSKVISSEEDSGTSESPTNAFPSNHRITLQSFWNMSHFTLHRDLIPNIYTAVMPKLLNWFTLSSSVKHGDGSLFRAQRTRIPMQWDHSPILVMRIHFQLWNHILCSVCINTVNHLLFFAHQFFVWENFILFPPIILLHVSLFYLFIFMTKQIFPRSI